MDFVYQAEFFLRDGTTVLKDMEEPGWLTPELVDDTVRISLVPKAGTVTERGGPFPIVVNSIPEGGRGLIKSRVMVSLTHGQNFRCFGVGYEKDGEEHWMWVLPTGDIENGDDGYLGNVYLQSMNPGR